MDKHETTTLSGLEIAQGYMQKDIDAIKKTLERLETKLDEKFVTNEQFAPVKTIVYGLVGMILTTVIGGLLTLLMK